jgi:hypothetical protein
MNILKRLVFIIDLHLPLESWVKPVFDVVVSPTRNRLGNLRPFVPVYFVSLNNGLVFFIRPLVFLNGRIQMIVPSFTTLLSNSSWKSMGYITPVLCSVFCNIFRKLCIFLPTPRTFDHHWIENFLPSMETLDISSLGEMIGNLLPVFSSMLID